MAANVWPVNAVSGEPQYVGRALRQTTVSPFLNGATADRPLGAASGVRPGTPASTVTVTSQTAWSCAPFIAVSDGETAAEAAAYSFSFDQTNAGTITAADASNPRIDIIYVTISDPAEGDGSTNPGATLGYQAGTAASTPVAPATPARSFVLAQLNVPKSGGGTPSVTWCAPVLSAAGGVVVAETLASLQATAGVSARRGRVVNDAVTTNNGEYVWDTTAATWAKTGLILTATGGGADYGTSQQTPITVNPTLYAGATYEITASAYGQQVTNAGAPDVRLYVAAARVRQVVNGNTSISAAAIDGGSATYLYTPTVTGATTIAVTAQSTSAGYRVGTAGIQLTVKRL